MIAVILVTGGNQPPTPESQERNDTVIAAVRITAFQ